MYFWIVGLTLPATFCSLPLVQASLFSSFHFGQATPGCSPFYPYPNYMPSPPCIPWDLPSIHPFLNQLTHMPHSLPLCPVASIACWVLIPGSWLPVVAPHLSYLFTAGCVCPVHPVTTARVRCAFLPHTHNPTHTAFPFRTCWLTLNDTRTPPRCPPHHTVWALLPHTPHTPHTHLSPALPTYLLFCVYRSSRGY